MRKHNCLLLVYKNKLIFNINLRYYNLLNSLSSSSYSLGFLAFSMLKRRRRACHLQIETVLSLCLLYFLDFWNSYDLQHHVEYIWESSCSGQSPDCGGKVQYITIKYDVCCMFSVDALCQIGEVPCFPLLTANIYHNWMLDFVKYFSGFIKIIIFEFGELFTLNKIVC